MIDLCITGVPGTGKTALCTCLNSLGVECVSAADLARDLNCIDSDTVDVDCLREKCGDQEIVEGHFSHLLGCRKIVILTCSEDVLEKRLLERGYSEEKIRENMEAQRSGIIYSESLDLIPSLRIMEIETSKILPEETAQRILAFLKGERNGRDP